MAPIHWWDFFDFSDGDQERSATMEIVIKTHPLKARYKFDATF